MSYNNRYTAKFAPLKHWDRTDKTKRGFIPVRFEGEIVWARPIFQIGSFTVPTKEFVAENIDKVAVIVETLDGSNGKLAWSGFTFWKDSTPEDTQEDYPYQKIIYSDEHWEVFTHTGEGKNKFHIKHSDGTLLELSREEDNRQFRYFDEQLGHKILLTEDTVVLKDGVNDITLTTNEDGVVLEDKVNESTLSITKDGMVLHDGKNNTAIESSDISLGTPNGSKEPIILGTKLVKMLNTVLQALATHTHPTGVGPSGPPINSQTYTSERQKTEKLKSEVSETE